VLHRRFAATDDGTPAKRTAILCRKKDAKKPIEWQADYFAACLLMPEACVRAAFESALGAKPIRLYNERRSLAGLLYLEPCVCNWPFIARAVQQSGGFSNVSKQALIIRLQELGLVINETTADIGWHFEECAS
jgi:Zn-dependent peptidase ImmA (M78 family)